MADLPSKNGDLPWSNVVCLSFWCALPRTTWNERTGRCVDNLLLTHGAFLQRSMEYSIAAIAMIGPTGCKWMLNHIQCHSTSIRLIFPYGKLHCVSSASKTCLVLIMFCLYLYTCSLFEEFRPPEFPFLLWLKLLVCCRVE